MSEWQETSWGEIATLEYGKSLKNYRTDSAPIPVYGTNGPIGFTNEALCKHPGVIIGRKGAYRGVHYSSVPFFVIDTAYYLKPINPNKLNLKFCYYKLLIQDINRLDSGSAIPSTSREDFYQIELELPPIDEQLRITKALECLDSKIDNLQQQNQTLEKIAQTLFKQWFVDFNFPDETGKPYKDNGGEMVGSELGEIPKGWSVKKLRKIITINPNEKLLKNEIVPYIDMKALSVSGMEISGYISRQFTSGSKFKNNDILLARITPCLENGKTAYVNILPKDQVAFGSTEFIVMRGNEGISPEYVYCLARSPRFRSYAILNMTGSSGRKRVPNDMVENYELPVSKNSLETSFSCLVRPLFYKIKTNQTQIQTLTKTRDTLLPKLMSGQIRIKD